MRIALRALHGAVRAVFQHPGIAIGANLTAVLLAVPLLAILAVLSVVTRSISVFPLGVVLVVGVLPTPAVAGVHALLRDLVTNEPCSLWDQWGGLGAYWWSALRASLAGGVALFVILLNLAFYAGGGRHVIGQAAALLFAIWGVVLVLWCALHLYLFPVLLSQESLSLRLAYRNALVLIALNPLVTLIALILWLGMLALMAGTGLITVIGLAMGIAFQQQLTHSLIAVHRKAQRIPVS